MRIALTAAIAASTLWAGAAQAESYTCVPDMATGFRFDKVNSVWKATSFRADGRYVVAPSDEGNKERKGRVKWIVKQLGVEDPVSVCEGDFSKAGNLFCDGHMVFRLNRNSLRFAAASLDGYMLWGYAPGGDIWIPEGLFTTAIEIGKCSRIP